MSLINQMLQDIDKRHAASPTMSASHHDLQGVMKSRFPYLTVGALGVLVASLVGVSVWVLNHRQIATPAPVPVPVAVPVAAAVAVAVAVPPPAPVAAPAPALLPAPAPLQPKAKPVAAVPVEAVPVAVEKPKMAVSSGVTRVVTAEQRAINLHRDATELVQQGRLAEAQKLLWEGVAMAPTHADSQALLATLLQREGRHDEAVTHFVLALRQAPDSANWLLGLGISLQAQSDTARAAEAYQRAIELGLSASLLQFAQDRLHQLNP
jgi:TolA-binding protein